MSGLDRTEEAVPQADHIRFLFDPRVTLAAFARQRRRLAATASTLTHDELAAPSRCDGWTVADVLRHLVWVDATMHRIWSGDESFAEGFDPRTTPDRWVQADRVVPDEEVRERYLASTETMSMELESAHPGQFGRPSLSPAGRVPWWLSAVHIGWDSAVHERDVLVPLGRPVVSEPDEMLPSLAYSLVIASFFSGRTPLNVQVGPVRVRRDEGLVTVGAAPLPPGDDGDEDSPLDEVTVLSTGPGPAVDALSGRGSLCDTLGADQDLIDRLGGLARYFTSIG